jgi:hypothetical protein
LSFKSLFNIGLLSLSVAAMLAGLFALGLGTLVLAIGTTVALMAVIGFHIHQISIQRGHDLTNSISDRPTAGFGALI